MSNSENKLIVERKKKISLWEAAGFKAYAEKYDRTHTAELAQSVFHIKPRRDAKNILTEGATDQIKMAGRIMNLRDMGKLGFLRLRDGTGDFQICLAQNVLQETYKPLMKMLDLGDFIGVSGEFFMTKHGEPTLMAAQVIPLSKSIRPLPEKWAGLTDKEQCYRQRHLDLISNPETMNRFKIRSQVIQEIRNFLHQKDFMEIETRTLQAQAGGAMARVFETHHNALDHPFVLRIALELDHKIAMAGGIERLFEIGKCFRNEGTDPSHLQEFTMLEWYAAYANLETNMEWMEDMSRRIVQKVLGTTKVMVLDKNDQPIEVDFGISFPKVRFPDLLKEYAHIDMATITKEELVLLCTEKYGMSFEEAQKTSRGNLLDHVYKKTARPNLIQPTFVMDYPSDVKPLARPKGDGTADCYQLLIAGWEVMNAYGELIDPQIQRQLLEEQSAAKAAGDDEAMDIDEEFLGAMETGMPPMTGFGMGIDRFVALLTGQPNLRDVVLFPLMRPEHGVVKSTTETMLSVALINREMELEPWQELNTVAHLTAALGARQGQKMFREDEIKTFDGQAIKLNTAHAIMIKTVDSNEAIRNILLHAKKSGVHVAEFTREMLETSDDLKVIQQTANKSYDEIDYLGALVYGKKSVIESLTKDFDLYGESLVETNQVEESLVFSNTGTRPLYLDDMYLFKTSARVLTVTGIEDQRYEIVLDQTIFYPQGGGQPADTGFITSNTGLVFEVEDVRLLPDGTIKHIGHFQTEQFSAEITVALSVTVERRQLNSVQHTAGHLVDVAAYALGLYDHITPTKGYHFSTGSYVQYDGTLELIDEALITALEKKCNELIQQDLKIFTVDLTFDEAKAKGIVAPAGKSARFVYFENYESIGCGCGGTHIRSTKEIQYLTIRKVSSKKGITKISYSVDREA